MKIKYRVLEIHYSDGSTRFFPQSGDWWHGWRIFGRRQWGTFSNRDFQTPISFESLEEAESFLNREIEWRKTNDPIESGLVYQVNEIIHKYNKKETH